MAYKVLLVDDHALLRKGLRLLLEQEADLQVVGEAENGEIALQRTQELAPDIVIMDISMPGMNGIEATRQILAAQPDTRVLALSIHGEQEFVEDMLAAGTAGYLLKESAPEELITAIRKVLAGEVYLSPAIAEVVVAGYRAYLHNEQPDAGLKTAESPGALLQTKFYPPPITADLVWRPRLLERLDRTREQALTLISAPAGYGKTVLVSQWLAAREEPSAWLSLDEHDNELRVFLSYLLAAVAQTCPALELETLKLLANPNLPPVSVVARTLANDLERIQEPFTLVLDDMHCATQPEIYDLWEILLQHPPRHLHLVLISRHDPALNLANLRARSQVTEIRSRDLGFTPAETVQLMQEMLNRALDPEAAAAWTEATEGWVTALRLAALSLRHRGRENDLSVHVQGDSRYLRDYLFAEVLSHLPASYQNCLVKLAFLDRFCGPLCEAVCQTSETPEAQRLTGAAIIAWLESENLFLIPLDDQHRWFRFHHLFQELLWEMLQKQASADELAALQRRASQWFTENRLLDEALHYALAAGDTRGAVALVAQHRYSLINAEHWNRLTNWIRLFPDDVIGNEPILAITKAHLPSSYGTEQERILSRLPQLVADLPEEAPTVQAVKGEMAYFGSLLAVYSGPPAVAIEQGQEALRLLPQPAERFRSSVFGIQAIGYQMSGDYQRGVNLLNKTLDDPGWSTIARVKLLVSQSNLFFFEGDLNAVQLWASETLKMASKIELWHTLGEAYYYWGISLYLRNELDLAEPHLKVLVDQRVLFAPIHLSQGVCALTRIYRARRQPDKARQVFDLAFSHLEEIKNEFALDVLRAFQVELALDEGDLTIARRLSRSVDFDMDRVIWYHYTIQLVPIKRWLAEGTAGSLEQAATTLEKLSKQLLELNRKTQHIDVLALQALVHEARGDQQRAGESLIAALRLGEPGGFIRSFVDLGAPMENLLLRLKEQETDREYVEYIEQILGAFPQDQLTEAGASQEILTDREYEVLSLLAKRLTNREIAEQLVISMPTVKSHTLNIYSKLGVNKRKQAVEKAVELGILPEDHTVSSSP